jgi:hypothetical protein
MQNKYSVIGSRQENERVTKSLVHELLGNMSGFRFPKIRSNDKVVDSDGLLFV